MFFFFFFFFFPFLFTLFSLLSVFVVSCFLLLLDAIVVTHTFRQIAPYLRVLQKHECGLSFASATSWRKKLISQTFGLVDLYYLSRHTYRETGAEAQ